MDALTDRPSGTRFERDPHLRSWVRLLAGTGFFAVQLVASAVAVGAVSSSAWAGAAGVLLLLLSTAVAVAFVIIRSLARELRETARQLRRLQESRSGVGRVAAGSEMEDPGRPGLPGHPLGPVPAGPLAGLARYTPALAGPDRRRPPVPARTGSKRVGEADDGDGRRDPVWVRAEAMRSIRPSTGDRGR